ncbi:MAG: SNF2-related protein [Aestuariivirga sp.]
MMIPEITDSLIGDMIQSAKMAQKGLNYWRQGRVSKLRIEPEKGEITAKVKGSEPAPYDVSIIFDEDDPNFGSDADCSCPVGIGCKHCAAVLYAARSQKLPDAAASVGKAISLPKTVPAAKPAPMPQLLSVWLADAKTNAKQGSKTEIVYAVTPRRLHAVKLPKGHPAAGAAPMAHEMSIENWIRLPSAGAKSKWRKPSAYDRTWVQELPASVDAWLVKQISHYYGDLSLGLLKGIAGTNWLDQAIATGRLRWGDPDGPALHFADAKRAAFRWVTLATGDQRLTLSEIPPALTLIALTPPLLIDGNSGAVHRIDTGVEPVLAERLLRLPPVPPHAVSALADQWNMIAGSAVPPPTLLNLTDLGMIKPTPVLTFREESVDVSLPRRLPFYSYDRAKIPTATARLEFDYDGTIVNHATTATLLLRVKGDATIQFQRDLAAERKALTLLVEIGLNPLESFPEAKPKRAQAWDFTTQLGATPAHFAGILMTEVPQLQSDGWRISYAPRWSLAFVEFEPDSLGFEVEPSGIDWFDIRLGARIDGKPIDILPMLRNILDHYGDALLDDSAITVSIEVAPGKVASLPIEKIRPVLHMLVELASRDQPDPARLRLPARDLAALADFESGTNAHIPWTGAEPLRKLAKALTQLQLQPCQTPASFKAALRPYQQQGLDWLQALHGAGFGGVLADDMGLGKTVQALAHITTLSATKSLKHPVLIVCPTSVLPNWQAELSKFAPELTVLLWHGATRKTLEPQIGAQDVILTSYPLLVRDIDTLKQYPLGLVIHDEAQMLKNPKTAGFKAAKQLKAMQTLAMTGTPVENQLTDAWSLMELVTPGLLGNLDHFNRSLARPIMRNNDAEAKRLLARRLRPFMLRRTKDQVASDLPAKSEIPEWIDLSEAQQALYESMRLLMQKRVREEIARVGLMRSHIIFLDALLKLRQICCDPRLLAAKDNKAEHSAKLSRLLEMLPELLAEGRKVILFSQFTAMLDLIKPELSERGIKFGEIRGATKDRQTPVKAFQSGKVPLILVSLKAGGTGLNLTAADTVILYDPWWNPAVEAQAIDRAHRIGQTKPVFVHRLIARGTIEEKILSLQDKKRTLAAALWGDEADGASTAKLTEEDVRFLLE